MVYLFVSFLVYLIAQIYIFGGIAMLTFKRFDGQYIVTHNGAKHVFAQSKDAWSFILSIINKEVA